MQLQFRVIAMSLAVILLSGCKAKTPSPLETHVVNWAKLHVTVGGKKDVNPLQPTQQNINDGKQAFGSYCAVCHGLDAQNTGVPFADSISPPVPSLASALARSRATSRVSSAH